MDRLSPLFKQFTPGVDVFFAGNSCQTTELSGNQGVAHLHLVQRGKLTVSGHDIDTVSVTEPSVIFSPSANRHTITPVHASGVDMLCATIEMGQEVNNPFFSTLPPLMVVPIAESPKLAQQVRQLFEEAADQQCGRDAALQLLTEYVLILILRHVMDTAHIDGCILSALGDEKLTRAINAIHELPKEPWTLETLASLSNMSRASFSTHFRKRIGTTPLEYLTDWRISLAKKLMLAGKPINITALNVGYKDASAFTRAFDRRTGETPTKWLAAHKLKAQ